MIKTDPYPFARDFGSEYDPVLHGVARSLGDLFPPIHNAVQHGDHAAPEDRELAPCDEEQSS